MSRICPQCHTNDEVTQIRGLGGAWTFTCDFRSKHDDRMPHTWEDTNDADTATGEVRQSLTPYLSPLRACLAPGQPYLEYGVVEWHFRKVAPQLFNDLVTEHGHRQLNPMATPKSTSAYLAQALGLLAADGELVRVYGTATGAWSYLGQVTYWAVAPGPATTSRLTWKAFAEQQGLDPADLATAG